MSSKGLQIFLKFSKFRVFHNSYIYKTPFLEGVHKMHLWNTKLFFNICLCYRDTFLISISDALTSVLSGFVVFSIMGYMAHIQNKDVTDPAIATDGNFGYVFYLYMIFARSIVFVFLPICNIFLELSQYSSVEY